MRHRYLARYYRAIIVSFSSIISVLSLVLCIYGAYIVHRADVEEIKTRIYLNPAATLVLGIYILLVGIIGLFGSVKKNKWAFLLFAALLFLLVVGEAIIGIMLITNRDKIKKIIKDHANDAARRHEGRESNFIVNWFNDIVDSVIFDVIFSAITNNFLMAGTFLVGMCFFQVYVVQVAIILPALLEKIQYYLYDI